MSASNEDVFRAALEQIRDLAARSDAHPDIEVGTIARAALTASSDAGDDQLYPCSAWHKQFPHPAHTWEFGEPKRTYRCGGWAADGPSVEASPGHVICPVCKGDGTGSPIGADGCGRCGGEGEVPLSQAKGAPSDDVGHAACRHLRVEQRDSGGWACLDCGGDATADVTGVPGDVGDDAPKSVMDWLYDHRVKRMVRPRTDPDADPIRPTRSDLRWWTTAEMEIQNAVDAVEKVGASPALTDAVVLLAKARDRVADHVEGNEAATPSASTEQTFPIPQVCPHCAQNIDIAKENGMVYVSRPTCEHNRVRFDQHRGYVCVACGQDRPRPLSRQALMRRLDHVYMACGDAQGGGLCAACEDIRRLDQPAPCRHLRVKEGDAGGWYCKDCGEDVTSDVAGKSDDDGERE